MSACHAATVVRCGRGGGGDLREGRESFLFPHLRKMNRIEIKMCVCVLALTDETRRGEARRFTRRRQQLLACQLSVRIR